MSTPAVTVDMSKAVPITVDMSKAVPIVSPQPTDVLRTPFEDLGVGALKELGKTGLGLARMSPVGAFVPPDNPQFLEPTTTAQKIGSGVASVGEFLAPMGLEAKGAEWLGQALPILGKYGPMLGRMLMSSLTTGTVNKAQGGSFGQGAALGAGAGAIGEIGRAAAPKLAETALGIGKTDRAYGKTVGRSVLNETSGIFPESVAASARQKVSQLTPQMESLLQGKTADPSQAVQVIDDAIAKAQRQNNRQALDQLNAMREQLTTDVTTGQPFQSPMPAEQLLDLKRGIREQYVKNWNPTMMRGTRALAARVSNAADTSLDAAGGSDFPLLNQRISSLIPAAEHGESTALAPTIGQRVLGRAAARTGALAAGTGGAYAGYHEGGVPGAVVGGLAGLVAPELVADPAAQMAAARLMQSGLPPVLAKSIAAQLLPHNRTEFGK